MACQEDFYKV